MFLQGLTLNTHGWHNYYTWEQMETVDAYLSFYGDCGKSFAPHELTIYRISDIRKEREDAIGANRKHPKVYVGFFSHSAFRLRCNTCRKTQFSKQISPASGCFLYMYDL
jgi:hypothetical protein